ncbi:hypothetical protein [Phycicoccus sp. Root101]|jgi:hypothetical protein|uniref:hypothetical protein n=1 Tax=Phycicoccus sp. Root101 TaxID=1736421 RepID=UPI0007029FDF|nr:hypothetical protein [Phycicoccus sp. Root101]KQU65458.1 hypothetical protein ASC58_18505 [Phycicoccus sp. Root101]
MKHQRLPLRPNARHAACATALAALALSGCGGGTPGSPVTVTVTPTVTASGSSSSSSSPSRPAAPTSDVQGRAFDYGRITKVAKVAGATVIELDRYTWKKLDDAKLARSGVPERWFKGKPPYTNQNDTITFTIPLAANARILYHHCVAADQPLQTRSATIQELAGLGDREDTVVVGLDDRGRLTTADNIAGCPG